MERVLRAVLKALAAYGMALAPAFSVYAIPDSPADQDDVLAGGSPAE